MRKKLLAYLLSVAMVLTLPSMTSVQAVEMPGELTTETAGKTETETKSVTEEETETETETKTAGEVEIETKSNLEEESGTKTEMESASEEESETEAETKTTGEAETETESVLEEESETEAETKTAGETETETESALEDESETEAETKNSDMTETETGYDREKILEEIKEQNEKHPNAYKDEDFVAEKLKKPIASSDNAFDWATKAAMVPKSYDARTRGKISEIKNQGGWGTCWAFSAVGIAENAYMKLYGEEADLSEKHLVDFFYNGNSGVDLEGPNGGLAGDKTTALLKVPVMQGGNSLFTTFALASWKGVADEAEDPLLVYDVDYTYEDRDAILNLDKSLAYKNTMHLENAYWINITEDTDEVKCAIMQYGAVGINYYADERFSGFDVDGIKVYYNDEYTSTNHAVEIIGWDDTFSKNKFNSTAKNKAYFAEGKELILPQKDGAWLIKNSWGTEYGNDGYFWISYEDVSLQDGTAFVFDFNKKDNYDHNYQYDGSHGRLSYGYNNSPITAAAVYEPKGSEVLSAVGVGFASTSIDYEIRIYTDLLEETNPESGTLAGTVKGVTSFQGFYTIELENTIPINAGEKFGIVVKAGTSSNPGRLFVDATYQNGDWIKFDASTSNDKTYVKKDEWIEGSKVGVSYWDGVAEGCTFRIKAYTKDTDTSETMYNVRFYDGERLLKHQKVKEGEDAVPPIVRAKDGYKFAGWDKDYTNITAETNIYTKCEPIEYTIEYWDFDENVLISAADNPDNPVKYTIETPDIELKQVKKDGYTFERWVYFDSDLNTYEEISVIFEGTWGDKKLYACFTNNADKLKQPDIFPESGIVEEGTQISIIAHPDAMIYYTIDGTTPSNTNGVKYTGPFELKDDKKETTVRAVAVWGTETSSEASAVYQYKLTNFILENVENPISVGTKYIIQIVQFPTFPEGYTREDTTWFSSDEKIATVSEKGEHGEVDAVASGNVRITSRTKNYKNEIVEASVEITIEVSEFTVRFLDADGELLQEQKVEKGSAADPPAAPVRLGYEFVRWEGGDYENVNSDLTLRAEYELVNYKITYDLDGGEAPIDNPSTYTINSETIVLKNPVKKKSFFKGWYKDRTYTGEPVTEITKNSTGDLTLYAKWFEPGGFWMEDIPPQSYTGSAVKPQSIKVYDTTILLKEGVDYTISYKNNVKAHGNAAGITEEKKAPTVIIKGKGNYSGTVSKNFEINPIDLNDSTVQVDDITVAYKQGKNQTPVPIVMWNGKKLAAKKDYDIVVPSNCNKPGTYKVTIAGKGNFTGQRILKFIIASEKQKPISAVKAAKIPNQPYGNTIIIKEEMLGLRDGSYMLKMGKDYTVDTTKYTDAGTHSIIVRGKGSTYIGMRRITFNIKGTTIKTAKVDSWGKQEIVFDGKEQNPKPVLKVNGETLKENRDYDIIGYENNRNAGTAKMFIAGKGAYSGTATLSFKIKPASVDDSQLTVKFASGSRRQPYEKGGTKPLLLVSFNGTLLNEGTDYTVSYKNNVIYPQTAGKEPTVIVTGRRNLTGKRNLTFSIEEKKLSNVGLAFAPDVAESTKPGRFYSTPQVFDTNGNKLKPGTDYKKELVYKNKLNKVLGKTDIAKAGDQITIELTGMGAYKGTHKCTYHILPAGMNIGKAKVKLLKKFVYTGEEITIGKSDLEVLIDGNNLTLGTNYDIEPYPGNQKKGKLRFLLKGKGTYGGIKTITVNVSVQRLKWWVRDV